MLEYVKGLVSAALFLAVLFLDALEQDSQGLLQGRIERPQELIILPLQVKGLAVDGLEHGKGYTQIVHRVKKKMLTRLRDNTCSLLSETCKSFGIARQPSLDHTGL